MVKKKKKILQDHDSNAGSEVEMQYNPRDDDEDEDEVRSITGPSAAKKKGKDKTASETYVKVSYIFTLMSLFL